MLITNILINILYIKDGLYLAKLGTVSMSGHNLFEGHLRYLLNSPKLLCFSPEGYDPCPGYWDKDLNWIEGGFDPYGWMVEDLIKIIQLPKSVNPSPNHN